MKPVEKRKKPLRFYELHPDGGGPRGLVTFKPKRRKQDRRAKPIEMFAVIFFPKISGIGKATMYFYAVDGTLAQSPEAARVKFMDRIKQGEKWETYAEAGNRIRRVRLIDLGDA